MNDWWNPFGQLGGAAAQLVTDAWTAAWLSLWNGGVWVLRLILDWMDAWLTPDLAAAGPGQDLYRATFWIAGVLVLVMFMVQLGIAAARRDPKGLGRAAVGMGQFLVVTAGWIGYTVAITAAAGGLTRALMRSLLGVTSWNTWQPWKPFGVQQIADAGMATVLGLMGLLMWVAAIGHLVVILARDAALIVLVATGPITAAGLVNESTRSWFWRSFRWFHAAAFTPFVVVLVTGTGMKFAEGVTAGRAGSIEGSIGTALPAIVLICIAVISPVALFKLLAFTDPGTASGASARAGMQAVGGLQGLLQGRPSQAANDTASQTSGSQSAGEATADAAATSRFAAAVQATGAALGPVAAAVGAGLGLVTKVGAFGAATLSDITNQTGIGHNSYQPDYQAPSDRAARANREANATSTNNDGDTDPGPSDAQPADTYIPPATSPAPAPAAAPAGTAASSGAAGASGAAEAAAVAL